jgi:hypothetical protein
VVGLATERLTVVDFKVSHFEREIVLWGVRWYVAYPISYRQLEEMMEERGVEVDHSSLNRCALKYAPLLGQAFRARKRQVGGSWRTDETYSSASNGVIRARQERRRLNGSTSGSRPVIRRSSSASSHNNRDDCTATRVLLDGIRELVLR